MPSLAAKSENKISSNDAADPVKQVHLLMEKRIRNLEKRKAKLDNYRLDVKNGKELNEDQKMAVSKYDEVDGQLQYMRELYKSVQTIIQESIRQQKKLAKREHLERQQHEIQRLQEAFVFRHILSFFENEDVRNDFLNGENGAVQLTSEQLSQLDQFYKLIGPWPGQSTEQDDISNYSHALAENHIFLVEGKNKDIVGTTYKVLKDLLISIKECGYFSRQSTPVEEDGTSSEDTPEEEAITIQENQDEEPVNGNDVEQTETIDETNLEENMASVSINDDEVVLNEGSQYQNGPLQDVLSSQSTFNFLQESQIDINAPHMDPAVVAVHQMAPPPPPSVGFTGKTYPVSAPVEEKPLVSAEDSDMPTNGPQLNQVPVIPAAIPRTVAPVLSSVQLNSQQEFDPSHPIPTQTFTNQSFAVMQNMILPQAYVPVTMHHAPMPHIAPVAVVPGLTTPVTSGTAVPMPVTVTPVPTSPAANTEDILEPNPEAEESMKQSEDTLPPAEMESNSNSVNLPNERNNENGYNGYRGGFGRGRGRGNNRYFRGRPNYNGRGGYQNHYYNDRNGYNGNFRRGNNRGPRGNGNNRGRGNYRGQSASQSSEQRQQQQQQTQQ